MPRLLKSISKELKIKLGRPNLKIIKKLDNEYSSDDYVAKKVVKKRDTPEVYEPPTKRKFDLREEIEGMIQLIGNNIDYWWIKFTYFSLIRVFQHVYI